MAIVERDQYEPSRESHADWLWDSEFGFHVPCCSQWKRVRPGGSRTTFHRLCHNGPLTGDQILTGGCGEHTTSADPATGVSERPYGQL